MEIDKETLNQMEQTANEIQAKINNQPRKEKMPTAKNLQSQVPEAIASATYQIKTPNGFSILFTVRDKSGAELLEKLELIEIMLIKDGYTPDSRSKGKQKKKTTKDTIPGVKCPKCGAGLVYFDAKGKKHIKCETQKFYDGKVHGCEYVKWANNNETVASPPVQTTTTQSQPSQPKQTTPSFEPATQAQMTIIKNKLPGQYREGLSKQEAYKIISEYLSK